MAVIRGIEASHRGLLIFDAALSPDGATLVIADGEFVGGPVPRSADLALATRTPAGFARDPDGTRLLAAVNTDALEYAPALSGDGLELFFTRAALTGYRIYRATRPAPLSSGRPIRPAGPSECR